MTIDEAVRRRIEQILTQKQLCDESKVTTIAKDAAKDIYELFSVEISSIKDEVEKQRQRQERLWDQIFRAPVPKLGFWKRWWRKKGD